MLIMGTIGWFLIIPGIVSCVWALVDFIIGICNIKKPNKIFMYFQHLTSPETLYFLMYTEIKKNNTI